MVSVRQFEPEDHAMVSEWWKAHGWEPQPLVTLSSYGMLGCVDDVPMAAGWLYITNSKIAWLEFVVADPKAPMKARYKAVKCVIDTLTNEAKELGFLVVFASLKSTGLIRLYKGAGFQVTDRQMTNMVKT